MVVLYKVLTNKIAASSQSEQNDKNMVTSEVNDLTQRLNDLGSEITDLVNNVNSASISSAQSAGKPLDRLLIGPATVYSDQAGDLRVGGVDNLSIPHQACFKIGNTTMCDGSVVSGEDWDISAKGGLTLGSAGLSKGPQGSLRMYAPTTSRSPLSFGFQSGTTGYRDAMTVTSRDSLGAMDDLSTINGDLVVHGTLTNAQLRQAYDNSTQALATANKAMAACKMTTSESYQSFATASN